MASISGKETQPEILIRRHLFASGYRFRKNVKSLLGKPDIVLTRLKTVVFVNGCFWHGHNCKNAKLPATNTVFWRNKIETNVGRDKRNISLLKRGGWKVIVVWQCQLNNKIKLARLIVKLVDVLENRKKNVL